MLPILCRTTEILLFWRMTQQIYNSSVHIKSYIWWYQKILLRAHMKIHMALWHTRLCICLNFSILLWFILLKRQIIPNNMIRKSMSYYPDYYSMKSVDRGYCCRLNPTSMLWESIQNMWTVTKICHLFVMCDGAIIYLMVSRYSNSCYKSNFYIRIIISYAKRWRFSKILTLNVDPWKLTKKLFMNGLLLSFHATFKSMKLYVYVGLSVLHYCTWLPQICRPALSCDQSWSFIFESNLCTVSYYRSRYQLRLEAQELGVVLQNQHLFYNWISKISCYSLLCLPITMERSLK
jgi:hypothetical protein